MVLIFALCYNVIVYFFLLIWLWLARLNNIFIRLSMLHLDYIMVVSNRVQLLL